MAGHLLCCVLDIRTIHGQMIQPGCQGAVHGGRCRIERSTWLQKHLLDVLLGAWRGDTFGLLQSQLLYHDVRVALIGFVLDTVRTP